MFFLKIYLPKGNNWKARRRLLTPAFHTKSMVKYLDIFNEKSLCHTGQLENVIGENNSVEIDAYKVAMDLALDIVCGILLH